MRTILEGLRKEYEEAFNSIPQNEKFLSDIDGLSIEWEYLSGGRYWETFEDETKLREALDSIKSDSNKDRLNVIETKISFVLNAFYDFSELNAVRMGFEPKQLREELNTFENDLDLYNFIYQNDHRLQYEKVIPR